MELFLSTLNQMAVLVLFMLIGFVLTKCKVVGAEASKVLSKLENNVFIPALVLSTFINQFTVATLSSAWKLLLFSLCVEIVVIPLAILIARLASKDGFIRKMYTYGLAFSNFGFMGNAVVQALFPDIFMYYLIFTLPLWTFIYIWGVPGLLIDKPEPQKTLDADGNEVTAEQKPTLYDRIKPLINPMIISLFVGMVLGIVFSAVGFTLPRFINTVVKTCGDCMSPVAMIITGITFGGMDFKKVLSTKSIYIVSAVRLIVFPLVFGGVAWLINAYLIDIPDLWYQCLVCCMAMPLGLNTVVVPAAYGKDTSIPAGMALVSHLCSVATIPLMLMLLL